MNKDTPHSRFHANESPGRRIGPILRTVLLPVLFCGLIFPAAPSGGTSFTVMTFNVRYDNPSDGENAWPYRKDMVASTILFHGSDIIGFQEALYNQIKDLESGLPEYAWFGEGRDDGKKRGEFNPIFYRKALFDILRHGTFWLSESPDVPGKKGWDAACARIVTWGEFRFRETDRTVYIFNTHFDHVGRKARRESAKLLLGKIGKISGGAPVILTGDFNCTDTDLPYRLLTTGDADNPPLYDSRGLTELIYGPTQTFSGFQDLVMPGMRIDFIFVRGLNRVARYGVISGKWDGLFASDHFPVLAEIIWPEK